MKHLGLWLVILAFGAGAFVSVLDPVTVEWGWMTAILAVGAIGLWLHRRSHHAEARAGARVSGDMETLHQSLQAIVANLDTLDDGKADLPVHEARFEIDRLFRDDLNRFAFARETMIHVFGMKGYADVMSAFAAGERYINRVWSASADGYVDEVNGYLGRARTQFDEALALFERLQREAGTAPGDSVRAH